MKRQRAQNRRLLVTKINTHYKGKLFLWHRVKFYFRPSRYTRSAFLMRMGIACAFIKISSRRHAVCAGDCKFRFYLAPDVTILDRKLRVNINIAVETDPKLDILNESVCTMQSVRRQFASKITFIVHCA